MNRKRIERLIPEAMSELQTLVDRNGKIPKAYDSYIAVFGPSVITSGLKMTVMFYEGDEKKKKINEIFWNLLQNERDTGNAESLTDYLQKHHTDPAVRAVLLDIAVACKLAVRTFELDKEKDE
jgi:CRISPR-associated protein Cmr5